MAENEGGLFRKSSLDRISSPEQLNEYIKITNPSLIGILIAIFTILIAGCIWIFTSRIPQSIDLIGIATTSYRDNSQKVYCYVPISTAKRLKQGMKVQISPDYAPREEYGYVEGKILFVGEDIIDAIYLRNKFENPDIVAPVLPNGNFVEVELNLGNWSNEKGKEIIISDGSTCLVTAVISQKNTFELMFKNS
ncbi:MAG: hypothetical protein LBR79_02910 [Oscillospiraceae bacterium]|jgi:hypothetical protein|nr:hypothetical protein [Oscillospiraceae bacterium]